MKNGLLLMLVVFVVSLAVVSGSVYATDFQDSGWSGCRNLTVNLTDGQPVLNALIFDVNVTGLTYSDISEIALSDSVCMEDGNEIAYQIWDNSSVSTANGSKWVNLMWQESITANITRSVWFNKNSTHSPNTTEVASRMDLDTAPSNVFSVSVFNCGSSNAIVRDVGDYTMFSVNGFGTSGVVCGWRFHHNESTKMINFSTDDFNTLWYRGYTNNTISHRGDTRTAIDYNIGTFVNYMPSWTPYVTIPLWRSYTNQSTQTSDFIANQFITQVNETTGANLFRYLFLDEFLFCNDCNATDTVVAKVENGPIITISSPINTSYGSLPIDLNTTINENASVCLWNIDGGGNTTMSGSETIWYAEISGISESTHWVEVWCNDSFDSWGLNDTVFFTYDNTPPTITLPSPSNGTTYNSTFDINVTVNENADWCWYNFDAGTNTTMLNDSLTNWFIEATPSSDGTRQIYIWCNDSANNWGLNNSVYINWDATAPIVTITSPDNVTRYTSTTVTLTFSSNEIIASAKYNLNSGGNTTITGNVTSLSITGVEGVNSVTVYVNDLIGNEGYLTRTFIIDTTTGNRYPFFENIALIPVALIVLMGMAIWFWGEVTVGSPTRGKQGYEDNVKKMVIGTVGVVMGIVALITMFLV